MGIYMHELFDFLFHKWKGTFYCNEIVGAPIAEGLLDPLCSF